VAVAEGSCAHRRDARRVRAGRHLDEPASLTGRINFLPLPVDPATPVETAASGASSREAGIDRRYRYGVYGIVVVSDTPLALPDYSRGGLGQVECLSAPASVFLAATREACFDPRSDFWYRFAFLPDGSTYARWDAVGEFLVAADGRRIACRRMEGSSDESFQVYMLGQALSFALVKQRLEPLHATGVVVDNQAVAFLGDSAFGKSSLAACFLEAGYRLLTDDLLILQESSGGILAYPGPPRIKLFSKIARRFLGPTATRVPMNPDTDKLILPIDEHRSCASPVALKAIFSLAAPRDACRRPGVSIEALSPRDTFVELVKGAFNRRLVSPQRLERQFSVMASLAERIPVKKLTYPRAIDRLPEVRRMVLADLEPRTFH
jgi:hypothetical protein